MSAGKTGALLRLDQRVDGESTPDDTVTLAFHDRQRSRLRVTLTSGREAAIQVARGEVLRGGDCLRSPCGQVVRIDAADEALSEVSDDDGSNLARAAYHLGNRHVAVEVGRGRLRYQHDHVLDHMLEGLGLTVTTVSAPFEPESGAYAGGHHHGHGDH